ncbi:glycosyltransferase family 2 protein [Vibrio parahaemolyticus]|uniref:Glycosyl transferase family protein n=3 Tax=Vibrio TaxID=662 RepID=A0A5Q5AWV9_VIBPH|nr:glycosyltransferase family 2 protein [Vibrio parahaemolyticus]QEQ70668.1 glycosyl transferase family protein [Vibrio parahaemolyticus]QOS25063.1 GalNAc(5)-diNAcBac-PP-undecaprenol beta-1,3-glucosyltransferase [Vibrio parahaemolyticus]QOS25629.1 GalNAc(5)-diNAcBac-PP-undecaprenol beta-1,3-glucosyltransferase [Vibrio parahaemolyticus]
MFQEPLNAGDFQGAVLLSDRMKMKQPLFTILTPTYNRANLLRRVFDCLKIQECKDFEWIIVDDGSTDDTGVVVREFKSSSDIDIQYLKKENGGKHTALNLGFESCKGELLLILDSDDQITPDALKYIADLWDELRKDEKCAGIIGLCAYMDRNDVIGDKFPFEKGFSTITRNMFFYGMRGDKCDFIRADYIKHLRFPVLPGQRFIPESLVTYELDKKYQYLCVNKILEYKEYQEGGITNNYLDLTLKYADGFFPRFRHLAEKELVSQMSFKGKMVVYANFFRYLFHSNYGFWHETKSLELTVVDAFKMPMALLIGAAYYFNDRRVK